MALTIANPPGGVNSILMAGATAAAPAANTVIVDGGVLGAGNQTPSTWLFSVLTGQTGTPDGNTANILFNFGGTNTGGVISGGTTYGPLTSFSAANGGTPQSFRFSVPAGGVHIYFCTGNSAGGAGAIYSVGVSITRLNSTGGWYF